MVDVNNIGGGASIGGNVPTVSVPSKSQTPLPSLQRPSAAQVSAPIDVSASAQNDEARYVEVQEAAAQVINNPYPVSNHRFTIFKDLGGDYVTRFTSLVDGTVKYYPEKTLFEFAQLLQTKAGGASFSADA